MGKIVYFDLFISICNVVYILDDSKISIDEMQTLIKLALNLFEAHICKLRKTYGLGKQLSEVREKTLIFEHRIN